MAENYELPLWAIRPNWSQPLIETLEWLSEVLVSESGAEQRIAFRLAPRRLIEARYEPYENERTFADLAMHRLGRNEWMMPLWFDRARLTDAATVGTSRLNFPTAWHEFSDGGMAYLVGPDCFSGEAVRIDTVDSDGVDLSVPLDRTWPAGTSIHPMRRGRFEAPSGGMVTSRLAEMNLRFECIEGNDISSEGTWETTHAGTPVLTAKPNWADRIDIDLSWIGDNFDSETGLKRVTDDAGRAFRQQQHGFILVGAQEQFEFRQMLYRLRGRQQPVWLPSQADDFTVAVGANAGVTQIDVEHAGYTYVGGPVDGRDRLYLPNGQVVQVSNVQEIAGNRERLTVGTATTGALAAGDRLSFVERCRLAQDSVEIEHLGDTDGTARSTLSFVAFADRRTATSAVVGVPAASMINQQCGEPEEGSCTTWTAPPVFEGWYVEFFLEYALFEPTLTWPNGSIESQASGETVFFNDAYEVNTTARYIIVRHYSSASYSFQQRHLLLQYPAGSVPSDARARLSARRWDGQYQELIPKTGSETLGSPFDIRSLWPDHWYFDF